MKLAIKKIDPAAQLPARAHASDAGLDLYAVKACSVGAGKRAQISTGIAVKIPEGHVGLVWDKSGLSHKHGLKTLGGVIDSGYTGEVKVGVVNLSDKHYSVEVGQKVAQLLVQKIELPELCEVDSLEDTDRGDKGFGSTGR